MIGYYPYVIVSFILIYPHSTNQTEFSCDPVVVKKELRKEKPGFSSSTRSSEYVDIACDKLTPDEKKELCDEAMREAVMAAENDSSNRRIDSFVQGSECYDQVPKVANSSDPHTCEKIPIEEMAMEKRMLWCATKKFTVENSDEIGQAEGFFISSSRNVVDRAFMFKPSPTNDENVIMWAQLEGVSVLKRVSSRGEHSSSSSSTAIPILSEENLYNLL